MAHQKELRVSHETIYQALFVQGKASLRAEVATALRCGRARRRQPRCGNHTGRARIPDMVNISQRPPEADDRAVPGHWEGDLERHEAPCNRVEVEDLCRGAVAAV